MTLRTVLCGTRFRQFPCTSCSAGSASSVFRRVRKITKATVSFVVQSYVFFLRFIAQKIREIHRVTKLRNCSFNQFALVVPRRASDRECTVLGSYEYSSEKQVQSKNTAAVG